MNNIDKKKISWTAGIGVALLASLIFLFIWANEIDMDDTGALYQFELIVLSILILAIAWVLIRLLTLTVFIPINKKRARPLPNIIKDIVGVIVYCIAFTIIITEVYEEPIVSIGAFLLSSWAVIGFAAKDIICDCINGIILDMQGGIEIGDWVKFKDGSIGQIIKMKMTGVELVLPDDTTLFVSNSMISNEPIINLNRPERTYYLGVQVVLEHTVPVDRARRILQAATISSPGVFNNDAVAFASSAEHNGVVYDIYFRIPNRGVWLESRHQVINSITKYLHKFGLRVCQITGELNVRAVEHDKKILFNDYNVTDALTTLQMSSLLEHCEENIQMEFADHMSMKKFNIGEIVVKEGDSGDTMYLVGEGIVDVCIPVANNESNRIACLVDGEYFGEMALLCGEKRNATIIARTDVVLYEIQRDIVKKFIQQYPDFAEKLSLSITKRQSINSQLKTNPSDKKKSEAKVASEFMSAFKKFLWDS
jgi:branched-chain amino acid transport system substrate-binding protein